MKNEIELSAIRSRPRFKVETKMSPKELSEKIQFHLKNRHKVLIGYCNTEVGVIRLAKDRTKYWAPQLQLRLEENPDQKGITILRGVFGPRPSIWTLFMFSYGLGAAIILTTGLYGWIELALGIGNLWVWTNLFGILLILVPYTISIIGQKIAKSHMDVLRVFIERVLIEEKVIQP